MSAGAVARGQGAIMAFQAVMGELVCAVAEQQQRAEVAEGEVGTLERRVRELERLNDGLERQLREHDQATYRRGYSSGHSAGMAGRPAEPSSRRRPLEAVRERVA